MTDTTVGWTARRSYAALAAGLVIIAVFVLVLDTAANPVLYLISAAYGTALSVVGAARMPPGRRRVWVAFAVAQAVFLVGDLIWTWYDNVRHVAASPSLADIGYLAMYPVFALGIWWLVRDRRSGADRAAFLDAAIVTTGVTVMVVVFLVAPATESADTTLTAQLVAGAYPVGDLLVLAAAFRLMTGGMAHNNSLWALLGSVVALLVVDVAYGTSVTLGTPYLGWIDCGYLLSYLLLGFAAVWLVAEWIETQAEHDCLVRLGVGYGQGYLLGRPGPLPEVLRNAAGRARDRTMERPQGVPPYSAP